MRDVCRLTLLLFVCLMGSFWNVPMQVGLDEVEDVFYCRKSFLFPEKQLFPHCSFQDEVRPPSLLFPFIFRPFRFHAVLFVVCPTRKIRFTCLACRSIASTLFAPSLFPPQCAVLDKYFDGSGYQLGQVNGEHWYARVYLAFAVVTVFGELLRFHQCFLLCLRSLGLCFARAASVLCFSHTPGRERVNSLFCVLLGAFLSLLPDFVKVPVHHGQGTQAQHYSGLRSGRNALCTGAGRC